MRLNKLFMGILGASVLAACSNEMPVAEDSGLNDAENRYMSVSIRSSVLGGTRAEGDEYQGGDQYNPEGVDGTYEDGYKPENKVQSLRFYFFDEDGKGIAVRYTGESYFTCTTEDLQQDYNPDNDPNVESVVNTVIIINPKEEANRSKIKKMVAVVNYTSIEAELNAKLVDNKLDLDKLTEIVTTSAINDDGFLMTNSVFLDGSNNPMIATPIKESDFQSTKELAEVAPVNVYVERVAAKVRVSFGWNANMDVVNGVTFDGSSDWTAVALKDKDGNIIKTGYGENDPQVYVIFQGWNLWWTADKTNLFKKVDNWELGWIWSHPAYNRSYWAENPEGVTLAKFRHDEATLQFGKGTPGNYNNYTAYCLENAADPANGGLKKGYNPAEQTTNRTLVYLKAQLVTLEGTIAKPADISEWAGLKYANKADLLAAMFEPNLNQFYFFDSTETVNAPQTDSEGNVIESGETHYSWTSLKVDDVKLVPAMQTDVDGTLANDVAETSPRYLSYVQLTPEAAAKKIYLKTNGGYKEVSVTEVNTQLASVGGAKVWEDGNTYYYQEIKHLGKTGADGTNYGIVRNHIYDMIIESVTGLGTPVLRYVNDEGQEVWEIITPQKPTPDSYFLGTRLNILSWRVVNNNVNLDW